VLENFRAWAAKRSEEADKDVPLRVRGTSFPFRIERDPKKCEGGFSDSSYCVSGIVGSLKNCCGDGVIAGDGFVLLQMHCGVLDKNTKQPVPLPTSRVTGKVITHKLISSGSWISFFCSSNAAQTASAGELYYAVSVAPTFCVRPIRVSGGAGGAPAAAQPPPQLAALATKFAAPVRQPRMPDTPQGMLPTPQAPGAAASAPLSEEERYAAAEAEAAELLASVPPATEWSGGSLNDVVRAAYLDPSTAPEKRIRMEFEYPELAGCPCAPAGYEANVTLSCVDLMPMIREEYAGQSKSDMTELFKLCPEVETVVDAKVLNESETTGSKFVLVARPPDVLDALAVGRPKDPSGDGGDASKDDEDDEAKRGRLWVMHSKIPVMDAVQYETDPMKRGDKVFSPFKCRPPAKQQQQQQDAGASASSQAAGGKKDKEPPFSMRVGFKAMIETWAPGHACVESPAEHFRGTLICRGYTEVLASALGMRSVDHWEKLAKLILENTVVWYTVRVNKDKTELRPFNARGISTALEAEAELNVVRMTADFATALRERIGIPITADLAAKLAGQAAPSADSVKCAKPARLDMCTSITENPQLLPEAVAARCDFFAVTTSGIHASGFRLSRLGPELGAALFSPEYYSAKPFVIRDAARVIGADGAPVGAGEMTLEPAHPIRFETVSLARDLLLPATLKYVFAVRPASSAAAARARAAVAIYRDGGSYNDAGTPIIVSAPASADVGDGDGDAEADAAAAVAADAEEQFGGDAR